MRRLRLNSCILFHGRESKNETNFENMTWGQSSDKEGSHIGL